MDKTYIPLALKAGARVFAGCRVDKILLGQGKAVGVSGTVLDRETGKPKIPFTVKSKIVIVACGAVFSPVLILRNHLANRNGQVGRHLRVHPCARVSALFDEEIEQWKGIMQSYYIDTYQKEGIMLEATGLAPAVAAASLPFFGLKQKELMSRFKNIVNLGLLVSDSSEGRVRSAGGRPLITYYLNHEDFLKTLKGLKLGIEVMFAAGAKEVYTGVAPYPVMTSKDQMSLLTEKNVRKTDIEYMAFHPMGSCRMGDDPAKAVVNRNLESHEVKNLFVSDAGIFPTSLGVNPQLSIMAFSTYLAEYLKENRKKYFQ
jgi:choline dehydrogenase-like flavoprotein